MKILTKKWVEMHEQVRILHRLKEFNAQEMTYKDIKRKSEEDFQGSISNDVELAKVCFKANVIDKLYKAKIARDKKALLSLPQNVYEKINDVKLVVLGYANIEDKKLLTSYVNEIIKIVEKEAEKVNRLNEISEDYLPEEFIVDEVIGELVYKEYTKGKDYFLHIGDRCICVEEYEIIERENFNINRWNDDDPLTPWTTLIGAELHYISNNYYELHLLLVNGDKYNNEKYWYFTLKGTNVKYVRNYE